MFKTAKLILLASFLLIFATVFALNPTLANDVVSAKYFWFYISIGLAAFAIAFFSLFFSEFRISFQFSDLLPFLFVLVGSLPFLTGSEAVNTKIMLLVLLFVLYIYFRLVLSVVKVSEYVFSLFLILTALVESTWGLRQLYGLIPSQHSFFLLTGSFFNPGPFSGYLAMVTPMAFYYLLSDYKVWNRKFNLQYGLFYLRWLVSAATLIAVLLVLPAAMSRAAWLAALGGCGVVLFLKIKHKLRIKEFVQKYRVRILKVAGVVFVLLIAGIWGMYSLKKDSADGRILIWKNTITAIARNPGGVGIGNFAGAYGKQQAGYFQSGRGTEQEEMVAGNPEYAFNEYLQIGLESGLAGLLLFLLIAGMAVVKAIKYKQFATLGALVSLLIFASMSYPFSVLPFLIVFVFLLANAQSAQFRNLRFNAGSTYSRIPTILSLAVSVLVVGFCLYNRYPGYQAYKDWNNAKTLFSMNLYTDVKGRYAELEPLLTDNVEFLFQYGQILSKTGDYTQSNEVLKRAVRISCDPMLYNIMGKNYQSLAFYPGLSSTLKSEYIRHSELSFRMAAHIVPNRLYPYYLLTKLYAQCGNTSMAIETARIVLQKEPKVHSPAIDEMREEVRKIIASGDSIATELRQN